MPDEPRAPDDELRELMNALADSVVRAPDDEVLEEARERWGDPQRRADDVRASLLKAVDDFEAARRTTAARPGLLAGLGAWLASSTAPRFALAALAVCALGLLAVFVWSPDPEPVEVVGVTPPPLDPTPQPVEPVPPPSNVGPSPGPPPVSNRPDRPPVDRRTPEPDPDRAGVLRSHEPGDIALRDVATVFVDLPENPSESAVRAHGAIVRQLEATGVLTALDDPDADARLRLQEKKTSLLAQFIVNRMVLWTATMPLGDPAFDADAEARRVVERMVETVKSER
jgi:hypothetical protein